MDRLAREAAYTLQEQARKRCADAIEAAGKARQRTYAAACLDRDRLWNDLRDRRQALRLERPRTPEVAAEIAKVEGEMALWKIDPPRPNYALADEIYEGTCQQADTDLKNTIADIKRRLRAGELDPT